MYNVLLRLRNFKMCLSKEVLEFIIPVGLIWPYALKYD